jgi:hypothetical protein
VLAAVAKQLATLDQISGGGVGLNIVAGWNKPEYEALGLNLPDDHETRYGLQGAETREIVLQFPQSTLKFTGVNYLTNFALPNFFFHVTTAYALLRKNGVDLGKRDFLGPIQ